MKQDRVRITCTIHGATSGFTVRGCDYCLKCRSERISRHRAKNKLVLIKCFGSKCQLCGYSRFKNSLEFHHLEKSKKSFNISMANGSKSLRLLVAEAKKCVLVCANCHAEIEGGFRKVPARVKSFLPKIAISLDRLLATRYDKPSRPCKVCGKPFFLTNGRTFCSRFCSSVAQRKIVWPSKEELQTMLWEKPISAVAKQLDVSDKAVAKWIKNYSLPKPRRGYWLIKR